MSPSAIKGNRPEAWDKFLSELDEKLQLGLLDRLERINSYHFEENVLYIEAGNTPDYDYLTKDTFFQQLQLLAQDAIKVDKVVVKKAED